ncbi:hypothetical protein [Marinitenerispora sediminis]|uniref:Uncharacterized protein n=1 Tax=Marinitenerispora sediminis TaxID=1931232 RepID=A0A368T2C8_9ACTN|nr:hypothetical protein [Marinitenerispora sediminis]RCV49876.1 hypothetical protein DEF28_19620 [Marinitenerispora sediminis]RCV51475.1 hypothetical protein DEF23_20365 [Marinitenerispora sediminis]RCV55223.1 hypothetical protein DEF24_18180 [Marinitenerispora sediminis]
MTRRRREDRPDRRPQADADWVPVVIAPDSRPAWTAFGAWLRANGIDWQPFADTEVRFVQYCSRPITDSRYVVYVTRAALRRLGLRPPARGGGA